MDRPAASARPGRPADRRQLSEEAAEHMRGLIMSGELSPGEFLRPERIAEDLGISVTPVREALLSLRSDGFVQQEPRRGFVVLPLTRQDVLDVFLVQAGLAGELAARAARRLTDGQRVELAALHEEMRAAVLVGDADAIEEWSFLFHRVVNKAAAAPKLSWFMRSALRYAPRRFYAAVPRWTDISVSEHAGILAALTEGREEDARRLMRAHILHSGELIADHLEARR